MTTGTASSAAAAVGCALGCAACGQRGHPCLGAEIIFRVPSNEDKLPLPLASHVFGPATELRIQPNEMDLGACWGYEKIYGMQS